MTTVALIPQTIRPLPCFAHLAGRTVTTRPSRALRRRMRTPETLTISQWSQAYRRVTEIDAKPGPWRPEMVPHTKPIMDSISLPWVRQVWICLPERGAKTQILLNTVCWGIDQGSAAGNIFWLMPTEHDARKAMGERIIPVLKAVDDHGRPGRIARYLSSSLDDTSRGTIRFNHGIRLFPAWANSPGSMAAYFGRINIADECDKFPERTSEGTDPITLFLKRARDDRHRSKYVFASTPAGRFIHKGTLACQQLRTWAMRCPSCGDYVTPGEEHLHIPDGTTPENVGSAELALACPSCATLWDEEARAVAYHGGREQIIKGAEVERPATIGHHAPAWVFPSIPLTEIATAKLLADAGEHTHKVAWANGYKVEDYSEKVTGASEIAHITRHKIDLPRNAVPLGTAMLGLLVDTQQDHFYYTIYAYSYAPLIVPHLLRHGVVQKFSDIDYLLEQEVFTDADDKEFRIQLGLIDSGGGRKAYQKHSRTSQVYEWCSTQRIMQPLKGIWSKRDGSMISYRPVDVLPGTNKRLPGGLIRVDAKVDYFKDDLARRLAAEPDDRGGISFHNEIDDGFARHFCAERKTEAGEWEHVKKLGRNDYWDCSVYALVLREILKTKIPRPPGSTSTPKPKPKPATVHAKPRRW